MVTIVIFFQKKKAISQFALVFFVTTMQKFTQEKNIASHQMNMWRYCWLIIFE
jgi:hypothetical protein